MAEDVSQCGWELEQVVFSDWEVHDSVVLHAPPCLPPPPRPSTKGHVCLTHCLSKTRMFSAGLYCVPWGKESFSLCLHGSSHPQREQWSWEPLTGLDSRPGQHCLSLFRKGPCSPQPSPTQNLSFPCRPWEQTTSLQPRSLPGDPGPTGCIFLGLGEDGFCCLRALPLSQAAWG